MVPGLGAPVWGLGVGMTLHASYCSNLLKSDSYYWLLGLGAPVWRLGVSLTLRAGHCSNLLKSADY